MTPAPIESMWTPRATLRPFPQPTTNGSTPKSARDDELVLPPAFLKLFFCAHARFMDTSVPVPQQSTEYLVLIQTLLNELRETMLSISSSEEEQRVRKALITDVTHVFTVWSFIDKVLLSDMTDRNHDLGHFLALWFRQMYPEHVIYPDEDDINNGEDENDDDGPVWREVTRRVLYGDLSGARQTLVDAIRARQLDDEIWRQTTAAVHLRRYEHIPHNVSPLIILEAMLDAAPEQTVSARADGSWSIWQRACANLIDDDDHAARVLRILSGDEMELANACSSWAHMLVACALYARDGVTGDGLGIGLPVLSAACGLASSTFQAPADIAGGALIEAALGNLPEAIIRLRATTPTPWFPAHLCDVLIRAGKLPENAMIMDAENENENEEDEENVDEETRLTVHEHCLVEFIQSLQQERFVNSCWRIAVDYCHRCPTRGSKLLVDLIGSIPIHDARTAAKVLRVCTKRGLVRSAERACEKMATLPGMPLGSSLLWCTRARRRDMCTAVARASVSRAERYGPLSQSARELEGVACAIQTCQDSNHFKLIADIDYAVHYNTMLDTRANMQADVSTPLFTEFVNALTALIAYESAHRQFWAVIAYETAKVIQLYPQAIPLFPRQLILQIISALELVSGPHAPKELTDGLRVRIAIDEHLMNNNNNVEQAKDDMTDIRPCGTEKLKAKLGHCRSVLLQALAKRINEN